MAKLKIADKWYERTIVPSEFTRVFEPRVHPFLRNNIWYIKGRGRDSLIDTGLGVTSPKAEIADLIDKPMVAVATHVH